MGSVAYKLALVSAGLADVTFTLTPKNEWDVAAGAALVQSAGGFVSTLEKTPSDRQSPGSASVRPAGQRPVPEEPTSFAGETAYRDGRTNALARPSLPQRCEITT